MKDKDIHSLIEQQNPFSKTILLFKLKTELMLDPPQGKKALAFELLTHLFFLNSVQPKVVLRNAKCWFPEYSMELQEIEDELLMRN